jgi:phytanoyl-CoA hydroxylase
MPLQPITIQHIAQYNEQGFLKLGSLFSLADCQELCEQITTWVGPSPETNAYGILRNNIWLSISKLENCIKQGSIGQCAASLSDNPYVTLFQDNLIWKTTNTEQQVEWHQDYSYWPLSAPNGITFWIPFDDTDTMNGCIHLIPQTHLLGERTPTNFISPGEVSKDNSLPPLSWKKLKHKIISLPMKAGECVAFHPLLWHMSPPNTSQKERRAWSITWLSPEVRWNPEHAPHPFTYWLKVNQGDTIIGEHFPRFSR